jgi:hypothetical protein
MNKKAQTHFHFDLRDIPIFIWILIVSIGCFIVGSLIPELSNLKSIGVVLFIIWLGVLGIKIYQEYS